MRRKDKRNHNWRYSTGLRWGRRCKNCGVEQKTKDRKSKKVPHRTVTSVLTRKSKKAPWVETDIVGSCVVKRPASQ